MKNKKLFAVLAMAMTCSMALTACNFGGKEPEQVVVEVTPTPEPTKAPEPTPTIAPDAQTTTYTSANNPISIDLPDATWTNKADEADMVSFESPDAGKILIMHGAGADAMATTVLPSSQDMAVSLEQAADLVQGTDFEIQNFTATDSNGVNVYSYVTKLLNPEKSDGYVYVVHKVFANAEEYYTITGSVKTEAALAPIQASIETFKIGGTSTLSPATGGAAGGDAAGTAGADGTGTAGGTSAAPAEVSEAAMSDTSLSRTIYNNEDGSPLVIQPNAEGVWADSAGNTYEFVNDEDVYDQNGNSFYYHGEAADVYYMPANTEE